MEALKKCLNPRVLIGLGVIAVGVLLFAPRLFASALPLLILMACPLSMVLMMAMMAGGDKKSAKDILEQRYAKGEIGEEDYTKMKANLHGESK